MTCQEAIGEQRLECRDLQIKLMELAMEYEPSILIGAFFQMVTTYYISSGLSKESCLKSCSDIFDTAEICHKELIKKLLELEENDTRK